MFNLYIRKVSIKGILIRIEAIIDGMILKMLFTNNLQPFIIDAVLPLIIVLLSSSHFRLIVLMIK